MTGRGRPRLSQHFLSDRAIAARIVDLVSAPAGARVAEIGPGQGALTEHLLARGWQVTAIELDARLAAGLRRRWGGRDDFTLIEADVLGVRLLAAGGQPWYVVGNLPYAITSPIVFHLLDQIQSAPIASLVIMVQREVADRLVAGAGSSDRGAISVGVERRVDVERCIDVGPDAFHPPPRVHSSVVRMVPHQRWPLDPERTLRVDRLVRQAFTQRRKQLQKSLRAIAGVPLDRLAAEALLVAASIDPASRPQELTVDQWLALESELSAMTSR